MTRNNRSGQLPKPFMSAQSTHATFTGARAMWSGLSYALCDLLSSLLRERDQPAVVFQHLPRSLGSIGICLSDGWNLQGMH